MIDNKSYTGENRSNKTAVCTGCLPAFIETGLWALQSTTSQWSCRRKQHQFLCRAVSFLESTAGHPEESHVRAHLTNCIPAQAAARLPSDPFATAHLLPNPSPSCKMSPWNKPFCHKNLGYITGYSNLMPKNFQPRGYHAKWRAEKWGKNQFLKFKTITHSIPKLRGEDHDSDNSNSRTALIIQVSYN